MPEQENNLPRLEGLFFAVCNTAIENTSWKFADFEKVKLVQGQLAALHAFFVDYYKHEQEAILAAQNKPVEQINLSAAQPATEPDKGISIPDPALMSAPAPISPTEPIPEPIIGGVMPVAEPVVPIVPTQAPATEVAPEQKKNLISPEEAKKAPIRPMPDDILDLVQAGVEVAKATPKVKDRVEAKEIPVAESPEDVARNKAAFHNIAADINDALEPGERYLTPEEAKARRAALIEERKQAGLDVFN